MRDLYLVDGYNVIFWVPDVFGRDDLESSRKKLIDLLQDYGAHNNIEMIVVFDGMGTSTKVKKEVLSDSFAIVFTPWPLRDLSKRRCSGLQPKLRSLS